MLPPASTTPVYFYSARRPAACLTLSKLRRNAAHIYNVVETNKSSL